MIIVRYLWYKRKNYVRDTMCGVKSRYRWWQCPKKTWFQWWVNDSHGVFKVSHKCAN